MEMINLLPQSTKKQLYAARTNSLLLRYNILLFIAFGFLCLAVGLTYLYLSTTKAANEAIIAENNQKETDYSIVQKQAKDFRDDLSKDKAVLKQSFSYTTLILEISKLIPSGVVLNNLSLDTKSFGTPTVFTFRARSYNAALALKNSFQNSTLFSNVNFAAITGNEDTTYPITVNLNVTIKKSAS
jgi:Tfp pilus assembly protein PilN